MVSTVQKRASDLDLQDPDSVKAAVKFKTYLPKESRKKVIAIHKLNEGQRESQIEEGKDQDPSGVAGFDSPRASAAVPRLQFDKPQRIVATDVSPISLPAIRRPPTPPKPAVVRRQPPKTTRNADTKDLGPTVEKKNLKVKPLLTPKVKSVKEDDRLAPSSELSIRVASQQKRPVIVERIIPKGRDEKFKQLMGFDIDDKM